MKDINNKDRFWELASSKIHGEISESESCELDVFLQDESFQKLFNEIVTLKSDLKETQILSEFPHENSWNIVSNKLKYGKTKLLWTISKYAAVLVFAVLMGGFLTKQIFYRDTLETFAEVKVPLGQMSEITLYDGTRVWLNSGTTFRYSNRFGKKNRNVELDGEAFFDVQKSKTPFKVKMKENEVEVLGTQFNVLSYHNEDITKVTLVEGSVKVNNSAGATIARLKPSQQIVIDEKINKSVIKSIDTEFYVAWTEGKIIFQDEKLSEIVSRLERWYNVEIQFASSELGDLNFSGTILKSKPFSQITMALELLLPINIDYRHILGEKDLVIISKK